ncbi:hypothetical protein SAMN02745194_03662 [Roseomonas rosea]|uniref:Uncharacterized protein n=1 Tax=Muricoccus roseus TaxID=198092 RepID=A0A1M6N1L7_9PROT|nr:hypothetical protein [Roseomonas rosea]SHJ89548.1 hypothetical protein SAMN02745194_03662 [Roseomonas rosea]
MQPQAESPRPLTLPPQGDHWRHRLWGLLGTVMFGAMLIAIGIYTVPGLVSDWRIRGTAEPVAGGRVTEGSCSSKLVLTICDATLSLQTKSGPVSRDVNYIFTDVHSGSYSVTVVADPAHPEPATTDMALEKLWNRTITLLVGGGILLALTMAPIIGIIRRLRHRDEASAA